MSEAKYTLKAWESPNAMGTYSVFVMRGDVRTTLFFYTTRYEDAKRLVACWNACSGIPTEALEAGVVGELVEACKGLLDECERGDGYDPNEMSYAIAKAQAALAKVWKGQP